MTDREIDDILTAASRTSRVVDPAALERITNTIHSDLEPVRPLADRRLSAGALMLIGVAVAVAGAARLGLLGYQALGLGARGAILAVLATFFWLTARELVNHWTPGSRHYLTPQVLLALTSATLLLVFAGLFHRYEANHFLSAGIVCLSVGVLHAAPAACLAMWFLRRGFAVEPVAAGALAGLMGGLSGVTMLELHCSNLDAPHVMVWHVAVVPVSAALGALGGLAVRVWRSAHSSH